MREIVVAERILSLTIAPDRAAALIGDLAEDLRERGCVWFWWSVLSIALSRVVQDLLLHPMWAIGRALWGLWMTVASLLVFAVLALPLSFLLPRVDTFDGSAPSPWLGLLETAAMCSFIPFGVGRQIARWSPGRELASAMAMTALRLCIFGVSSYLSALQMRKIGKPFPVEDVRALAAGCVCMLLGAFFQRWLCTRHARL
jgi:hypothetical protein